MKKGIRFFVLITLLILCNPRGILRAETKEKMDPWAPFHPGSWITVKEVETYLGKTKTTLVRRKITRKKEGLTEVWNFTEDGSRKMEKERGYLEGRTPQALFMKEKSSKVTSVRVGPFVYRATKTTYVPDKKFSLARGSLTIYESGELKVPYREMLLTGDDIALARNVVRAEYLAPDRNAVRMMRYEAQIVTYYHVVAVGGEKIPCFIEETKVTEVSSGKKVGMVKRWLSDKIPGHTVKVEYHFETPYGPGEFFQSVQDYHLVTFRSQSITMEGATISFDIPSHFRRVAGDKIVYRSPMGREKRCAFSTEEGSASIIVQVSEPPSELIHEVKDLTISGGKSLVGTNPHLKPYGQGFTMIQEREFMYQEFINTISGADYYTYNLSTLHERKIVSLEFTMSRRRYDEYEQLRQIWVKTIRIE